jgi:deoxyribodipyrimidine photolyase-related protein
MTTTLRLILGDQLNENHPWFSKTDDKILYVMMETRSETDYTVHHIQKITAFFMAMRKFEDRLRDMGHRVHYLKLDDTTNQQSISANMLMLAANSGASTLAWQLPDEYRMQCELDHLASHTTLKTEVSDSFHFIVPREFLQKFFAGKKTYLMESFYRAIRRKTGLLMEGESPVGEQWNFDHDNRGVWKGDPPLPIAPIPVHDGTEIMQLLHKTDVHTMGEIPEGRLQFPLTRSEALELLEFFCREQLPYFGKYQDAMHTSSGVLFHSMLSFALNVKLIHPLEVCRQAESAYHNGWAGLAQVEGFIRQIIGWREYVRGIYWAQMPDYVLLNYFNHQRKLPAWFWDGNTKMKCMSQAIGQSLGTAYAHHIQRLMVVGNFALLYGAHPDEVDQWYLGVYTDALEWVQLPNTRGMSQFADGGIVGTKPYVSTANYINKMSNYCSGCVYNEKERTGEKACPFNSLYWYFYDRHRAKLEKNPRIGMMYRTWDKMNDDTKTAILHRAEYVIAHAEEL